MASPLRLCLSHLVASPARVHMRSPCRLPQSLRRIRIKDSAEPQLQVEGFANYADVLATDLVPWTPLKAGYSHMDADSALFILQRVAPQFVGVVSAEASTLPEGEGKSRERERGRGRGVQCVPPLPVTPVWKRAVQGLREVCDTCDTAIFNFHWICPHCGFAVCPACYQMGWDLEEGADLSTFEPNSPPSSSAGYDVPSSAHRSWPGCTSGALSHLPSSLIVAQIIPADGGCGPHHMTVT